MQDVTDSVVGYFHAEEPGALPKERAHALPHLQLLPEAAILSLRKGARDLELALETMRLRYDFLVLGYVVMPEHAHILVSEPKKAILAKAVQALKLSVSVQSVRQPFWQARYYDFNVFTHRKLVEKLRYMHRNPVKRELVAKPEDWAWSSFNHFLTGVPGTVEIESNWTVARRDRAAANTQVSKARPGGTHLGGETMRPGPPATSNISGNPDTIDVGTSPKGHGNYGSNVMAIAGNCFPGS